MIKRDGQAIIHFLDELRQANAQADIVDLTARVIDHASKLVPYEEMKLKAIEPNPTAIMHRMRSGSYADLFPRLFTDVNSGGQA